jgi:hypothetical protein
VWEECVSYVCVCMCVYAVESPDCSVVTPVQYQSMNGYVNNRVCTRSREKTKKAARKRERESSPPHSALRSFSFTRLASLTKVATASSKISSTSSGESPTAIMPSLPNSLIAPTKWNTHPFSLS